jgi:hypothetical protein
VSEQSEQPPQPAAHWWESIEEHVTAREAAAPDPWADRRIAGDEDGLTDDQTAFLAGLSDQPAPPRIAAPGGVETGNSPGDEGGAPDVPSSS